MSSWIQCRGQSRTCNVETMRAISGTWIDHWIVVAIEPGQGETSGQLAQVNFSRMRNICHFISPHKVFVKLGHDFHLLILSYFHIIIFQYNLFR